MKSREKFPEKKDFFYWLLIIGGIAFYLFVKKFGQNDSVVQYFGFAGTLISIILAVLAITYSFYQNSSSVKSTAKLIESAEKIEEVTSNLESIDINVLLSKLDEMTRNINTNITDTITEFGRYIPTNLYRNTDESIKLEYTEQEVYNIISNAQGVNNFFLVTFFILFTENKRLDASLFVELLIEYSGVDSNKQTVSSMEGVFYAFKMIYHDLNIMKIGEDNEIIIESEGVIKGFEKYINEKTNKEVLEDIKRIIDKIWGT